MTTQTSCRPIAQSLDLPEVHCVSQRYGSHWQTLSKATKWALCGIWSMEAAAYCTERLTMGQVAVDIMDGIDPMLEAIGLSNEEKGDVYYLIGELANIDEIQQARLVQAIAETIAAGIYQEHFSDLFAEA